MEGFSSNLNDTFTSTRGCAEPMFLPQHILPLLPLYNAQWWGYESLTAIALVVNIFWGKYVCYVMCLICTNVVCTYLYRAGAPITKHLIRNLYTCSSVLHAVIGTFFKGQYLEWWSYLLLLVTASVYGCAYMSYVQKYVATDVTLLPNKAPITEPHGT